MAGLARIYPVLGEATIQAAKGAALALTLLFLSPLGPAADEGAEPAALSTRRASATRIVISKRERALYLYNGPRLVRRFPVAVGKHAGDKLRAGDMRTPEGRFYIQSIHDSRSWVHDFGDGKGPIPGAYGPFFLRLYTGADRTKSGKGWRGIGIHGTHDPASIGQMATEGCIRMHNRDLEELRQWVIIGTPVVIE